MASASSSHHLGGLDTEELECSAKNGRLAPREVSIAYGCCRGLYGACAQGYRAGCGPDQQHGPGRATGAAPGRRAPAAERPQRPSPLQRLRARCLRHAVTCRATSHPRASSWCSHHSARRPIFRLGASAVWYSRDTALMVAHPGLDYDCLVSSLHEVTILRVATCIRGSDHAGLISEAAPAAAPEAGAEPASAAASKSLHLNAAQKRTAEAAGMNLPEPFTESNSRPLSPTAAAAGGSAQEASMDASASRGQSTGAENGVERDAASQAHRPLSAAGAADVAVGNLAKRLRRGTSRSESPQSTSLESAQAPVASGARQDLRTFEQPAESSAGPSSAAASAPQSEKGNSSADGQAPAGPSALADSAAASLVEGACLEPLKGSHPPSVGMQGLPCSHFPGLIPATRVSYTWPCSLWYSWHAEAFGCSRCQLAPVTMRSAGTA